MTNPPPPPTENARDAKARAKGEKAYRKAQRPWYKKKRFILPLALVVLIALFSALGGGDETANQEGAPTPSPTQSQSNEDAAAAEESDAAAAEESEGPEETTEAVEAAAEPEETSEPAPEAIEVSAQEMIDTLEGNALNAKNTYEGQRVTVSGVVGNIDASGNYFSLDPEPEAFILTGIQVQTSEEFLDQVATFSAGQAVTVTGMVTDVGEVLGYSIEAETIEE